MFLTWVFVKYPGNKPDSDYPAKMSKSLCDSLVNPIRMKGDRAVEHGRTLGVLAPGGI
jgi:hypothetical protein